MTPAAIAARNRLKVILAFASVYFVWGSTYLFIKYAVETIPPFMIGASRNAIAGALLFALMRWRGAAMPTRAELLLGALSGVLMLGFGNGGVIWAEQSVPSGATALIVSSVPIWIALLDWTRPAGRRPRPTTMVGLALGFLGIVILIGPRAIIGAGHLASSGVIVLLIGSLAWSIGSLMTRGKRPSSPFTFAAVQMAAAAVAFSIASVATGEPGRFVVEAVGTRAWLSMIFLTFFGSIVGFSAYIYLLANVSATKAATYAYVNPIIAVLLGWAFANEPIGARTLVAAVVILGSVALITSAQGSPTSNTGEHPLPTPSPKQERSAA